MQRLFLTEISTVHGFCSDLLREYAYKLDIAADFRVADENECREIRETVLEGLLDIIKLPYQFYYQIAHLLERKIRSLYHIPRLLASCLL